MTPLDEVTQRLAALARAGPARDRFLSLGLPTTQLEAWKHTSLAPLAEAPLVPAPAARWERAPGVRDRGPDDEVFVPLDRAFTALNLASAAEAAVVEIPPDASPGRIELVFVAREGVSHPLALVRVGAGSRLTLVERHVGDGRHLTNAVTQIDLAENAAVEHVVIVEGPGLHIGLAHVRQARDSRLTSQTLVLGGRLCRREVEAVQHGAGADCVLDGLYLAGGGEHVDCQTTIDHAQPHGSSRELYKGVLGDGSEGVFNGRIIIRADAQKTAASQTNRNLLLSERARVDTRPQLEIRANDVRCSHGATVGQLDREALFYLRSRGLPEAAARRLLCEAFVREILDRIAPAARAHAEAAVARRLP